MKVIDLLNKIANEENVPNKIEVDGYEYEFDEVELCYMDTFGNDLLEEGRETSTPVFLKYDVIEIKEGQEEQDKIDIQGIEQMDITFYNTAEDNIKSKINELIRAVKQLDTEIKEINNAS